MAAGHRGDQELWYRAGVRYYSGPRYGSEDQRKRRYRYEGGRWTRVQQHHAQVQEPEGTRYQLCRPGVRQAPLLLSLTLAELCGGWIMMAGFSSVDL